MTPYEKKIALANTVADSVTAIVSASIALSGGIHRAADADRIEILSMRADARNKLRDALLELVGMPDGMAKVNRNDLFRGEKSE